MDAITMECGGILLRRSHMRAVKAWWVMVLLGETYWSISQVK